MKSQQLSIFFVIGLICIIILARDISVFSIVTVCTIIGIVFVYQRKIDTFTKDVIGDVLAESDPTLTKTIDILDTWRAFDEDLYQNQYNNLNAFYDLYGIMLLDSSISPTSMKMQFDILWDLRTKLINDAKTWILKTHTMINDEQLILDSIIALTMKCVKVLLNKFPYLIDHYITNAYAHQI